MSNTQFQGYHPLYNPYSPAAPSPGGDVGDLSSSTFGEMTPSTGIGPLDLGLAVVTGFMDLLTAGSRNRGAARREEDARQWNLEQWERQNLYNHPIQQMQRLKEAGLNPNLIYGSSPGSATGNAGAVHPGKAAPFTLPNFGQHFQDGVVKQAQSQNLTASALNTLELRGLNKVNKEIAQESKGMNLEMIKHNLTQTREKALQEQYNTLELSKSWQHRTNILLHKVKQAKAEGQTAVYNETIKELEAHFAEEYQLRPNDPFWARGMMNLKEFMEDLFNFEFNLNLGSLNPFD